MKLTVFTALLNGYDELLPIKEASSKEMEFVCFTNRPEPDNWRRIGWTPGENATRESRRLKLTPHKLFPDSEWTLWMDACIAPRQLIAEFIEWARLHGDGDIYLFRHWLRDCIYAEADECLACGRGEPKLIEAQKFAYGRAGYPPRNGLWRSDVILRRNTPEGARLNEAWLAEVEQWSARDQISFPVALAKSPAKIVSLPCGEFDDWFAKTTHLHEKGFRLEAPPVELFYVHVPTPDYIAATHRFARTFREFAAGWPCSLTILSNGGEPTPPMQQLFDSLPDCKVVTRGNDGWDIGAFMEGAQLAHPDAMMVCLGANVFFWHDGWLKRLVESWRRHGPGIHSAFASYALNPHLNTIAFACPPALLLDWPKPIESSMDRYAFEHGPDNFALTAWRSGLPAMLVTWDGEYSQPHWRKPENGFLAGDESNCLVRDEHTSDYLRKPWTARLAQQAQADNGFKSAPAQSAEPGTHYLEPGVNPVELASQIEKVLRIHGTAARIRVKHGHDLNAGAKPLNGNGASHPPVQPPRTILPIFDGHDVPARIAAARKEFGEHVHFRLLPQPSTLNSQPA